MRRLLILSCIAALLSGCVVTPVGYGYRDYDDGYRYHRYYDGYYRHDWRDH